MWQNAAVWILLICYVNNVKSYVWTFGECAIYYEEACTQSMVQFRLYVNNNNQRRIVYLDPFKPILPRGLNPTNLKILIHGYGGLGIDYAIKNVSSAYKEVGISYIIVDWSALAAIPCYPTAFFNTWHVGQCTAILSISLAKYGLYPNMMHVVGFSLGAHIASFASNQLDKLLGMPYYRITGLDPALPLFATLINQWKLDPSDAPFVDVIHTSAGSFGKLEAVGHADFYINGGTLQPKCFNATYPQLCSHVLVGKYFANTIRNHKYFGYPCHSILHYNLGLCSFDKRNGTLMGEYISPKTKGIYFVEVQDSQR